MPPTDPPTTRSDKHERILDAAIDVFAERGFHNARIADIARKAGVADGTIYNYFHNKDDVLLSIFEEKMGQMIDGITAALEGVDDPLQKVRVFALYHLGQVEKHRALAEVLQIELRLSHKFLKEYRPEKLWSYLNIFAGIVRDGQARGLVRPELDPFVLMWAFFGAMDESAIQWVLARKPEKFPLQATAETVADIFIRGMATAPGQLVATPDRGGSANGSSNP